MKDVSLLGLHFERLYTQEVLQEALSRLATNITRDFSKFEAPLALCILNGSFIFAADLLRLLPFELLGLTQRIDRRDILIIEDIVDTGLTMQSLLDNLKGRGAHSIRIATMFTKSEAFVGNFAIDYVGFDLPNRFVVGYGLDYNGLGRNLSDLYILSDK